MTHESFSRRKFITLSTAAVAAGIAPAIANNKGLHPTAKQAEGPFFQIINKLIKTQI